MKHLRLEHPHYEIMLAGFAEWLTTMGYAEPTIATLPVHLREFFHYAESKGVTHISEIDHRHVGGFLFYLQHRTNRRYGEGGLSTSSVNKTILALNSFTTYINNTTSYGIDFNPRRLPNEIDERTILTTEEILKLYDASFLPSRQNHIALGQRDRAMIAIFYGCGLRKKEGLSLNVHDVDLLRKKVLVRNGKGNKQRYVPIASKHADDLKAYIEDGRSWFLEDHYQSGFFLRMHRMPPKKKITDDDALFLSMYGTRMTGFHNRLNYLGEHAGIEKQFSLHSLRHSIATHLLQSGMPIEEIAKFLGHASLESTQIYTHIVHLLKMTKDEEITQAHFDLP